MIPIWVCLAGLGLWAGLVGCALVGHALRRAYDRGWRDGAAAELERQEAIRRVNLFVIPIRVRGRTVRTLPNSCFVPVFAWPS